MNNDDINHLSFRILIMFIIMVLNFLLLDFTTNDIKHEVKQIHETVDNISKGKEIE